jgi:hypothetical protein
LIPHPVEAKLKKDKFRLTTHNCSKKIESYLLKTNLVHLAMTKIDTNIIDSDKVLKINGIDINAMSIKGNGKYITTKSARQTDVMRIIFQIENNENITPGYKEVYILIQNPKGKILNKKGTFEVFGGKELYYTEKTNAYYTNNYLKISILTDRFIQKITRGYYTITIYIENYPVGLEVLKLR